MYMSETKSRLRLSRLGYTSKAEARAKWLLYRAASAVCSDRHGRPPVPPSRKEP